MTVNMQLPSALATWSVGYKESPRPQLSTGAAVATEAGEGPWVASLCSSPV